MLAVSSTAAHLMGNVPIYSVADDHEEATGSAIVTGKSFHHLGVLASSG